MSGWGIWEAVTKVDKLSKIRDEAFDIMFEDTLAGLKTRLKEIDEQILELERRQNGEGEDSEVNPYTSE